MTSASLYWHDATLLWLALLPLLLGLLLRWNQQRQQQTIADRHLLPWLKVRSLSVVNMGGISLLALAWLFLVVAMAGPRTAQWIPPDIVADDSVAILIIDSSASMTAKDFYPDRRAYGIHFIAQTLPELSTSLKIGLLLYAGASHTLMIPSLDRSALVSGLQQVNDIRLPTLGNQLAQALIDAKNLLVDVDGHRTIILLSDGDLDEPMQQSALTVAQTLAEDHIKLIVLGVGGHEAVSLTAIKKEFGSDVLRQEGQVVLSQQDRLWLNTLAGNGHYLNVADIKSDDFIDVLSTPTPVLDDRYFDRIVWNEWFFIPLGFSIALLILALNRPAFGRIVMSLLLVFCLPLDDSYASNAEQPKYLDYFEQASGCYREQDYNCAAKGFSTAAWLSESDIQRATAVFNLGNSQFKLGLYEDAAVSFRDAGVWGIDRESVDRNLGYAQSLARAVRQQLADIAETERRADFRAQRATADRFENDRLANSIDLSRPKQWDDRLKQLSSESLQTLLQTGILQREKTLSEKGPGWVATKGSSGESNAAEVSMRLFEMELGIPVRQTDPYQVEGQRLW